MRLPLNSAGPLLISSLIIFALATCAISSSQAEGPEILAQFEIDTSKPPIARMVEEVNAEGKLELAAIPERPPAAGENLDKGYYLAMVFDPAQGPTKSRIVLIRLEVIGDESISARVSRGAAKVISQGNFVGLFRPEDATKEQLVKLPLVSRMVEGKPPVGDDEDGAGISEQERLAMAMTNMKELGLALHNYASANGTFPPAHVVGSDGKPWHSWRALLLPYLDSQQALSMEYRLDEPWDSPHNMKLLDKKPAVYGDPLEQEGKRSQYTHVAAMTGDGMLFSAEGGAIEDGKLNHDNGIKFAQIRDGFSNTLMLGPVSEEAKIPWTKPEDLSFTDPLPQFGTKGGFALDYTRGEKRVGPFLFADGSASVISESSDPEQFLALLTIDGREEIDFSTLIPPKSNRSSGVGERATLTFVRDKNGTTAYIEE